MKPRTRAKKPSAVARKKEPGRFRRFVNKNRYAARLLDWRARQPRWKRRLITAGLVVVALLLTHNIIESSWRPVQHPEYGVSFSIKYSQELGLNWQENYLAVVNELGFTRLRLMSYWDLYETSPGQYDFSSLDWQMDEAAKRGIKVSLALGLRQPRWPECHQPQWARELGYGTRPWQDALNRYIDVVVNRYKNHPALLSYQLENEAVNSWFGECIGAAPRDRLIEEFNLVKQADPNHPVWMSLSDQHGFPLNDPRPDAYGFSVYRVVWNDKTPIRFYLIYPTPIWYHKLRKWAIELFKDRSVFVHELQVEPWGPVATRELSIDEQNKSMSLKQIHKNFDFARKIGTDEIYTWGGEWWYWRKVKFSDPGPWEAVRTELRK